ncbi:hypothetical protein ACQP2F_36245 [Actinoplanes sp. CA-030573]|uniref:hypothetical protein n=1 Tax=Actinoplanes sp. CA-030573 TaxID=3239898 RepID=UPI003D8FE9E0
MSDTARLTRRRLLVTAGAVTTGAAVGLAAAPTTAEAAGTVPAWTKRKTQNGWPTVTAARTTTLRIEGSDATVALLSGDVATVLMHVARRLNYEVVPLASGDAHGHRTDHQVQAPFESNYLSGTALAVRPREFPAGSAGNLFPAQLLTIRDILAECEGVVRWGGDDKTTPKEGHFQIDVRPTDARLARLAATLTAWSGTPGQGPGTTPDPTAPTRRAAATALARAQRR